ncbi:unnamed protein product [Allacma fusca]|uniref:Galactosylgalactosylxylosylprotein 3-beta-glucuronosyltransferase n=1 Tax=Allacma fusca TaxID=39272 RepID=A0A8J2PM97_9HEXA|nr:unnamed protein product [Allacma fusca]
MAVSPLHKSLFVVILVGITFCTFTFLAVNHPQQVSYSQGGSGSDELGVLSGRTFSIRVDDVIVHNISERVIENIKSDNLLCTNTRDTGKLPTIYFITPTYKRPEQIPDLTRLSQTLMHVPSIMWLVIEDAEALSPQVSAILRRSGVRFIHMIAPMPKDQQKKKVKARGVSNRNKGLEWIRENYVDTRGVVYFADDDNTYDLRLFDEIRSVKRIGMWPVGLITNYGVSSPVVKDGKVVGFYDGWVANRKFPVDMAGFAVSVQLILENSKGKMPFTPGYEEDRFLQNLGINLSQIEPKANNCTQIYVWHTQTKKNKPPVKVNETLFGDSNIMTLYQQIAM